MPEKHTLELLADQLHHKSIALGSKTLPIQDDKELDKVLHAGLTVSFIEATYALMRNLNPTPLYRIRYDHANDQVAFDLLAGQPGFVDDTALDVDMLDLLVASTLREELPILIQGETGVGKTYTVSMYLSTIFDPANYALFRVQKGSSSVLLPFMEVDDTRRIPRPKIDVDAVRRIAAVFIDELNRGDPNQVLPLLDGEVHIGGKSAVVGVPIPFLYEQDGEVRIDYSPELFKRLTVFAGQNPPHSEDPRFVGNPDLDGAVANRLLKINHPNTVPDARSSGVFRWKPASRRKQFMKRMGQRAATLLLPTTGVGLSSVHLEEYLQRDWLGAYAYITNPERTRRRVLHSAAEVLDLLVLALNSNGRPATVATRYEQEQRLAKQWSRLLASHGYNNEFESIELLDMANHTLTRVLDNAAFKEEFVHRDMYRIRSLADAIATIRAVKSLYQVPEKNRLPVYLTSRAYLTLEDMISSFALVAYSKLKDSTKNVSIAINQVVADYISLMREYAQQSGIGDLPDLQTNSSAGIRNLAFRRALKKATHGDPVPTFIQDLSQSAEVLKRFGSGTEIKKILVAGLLADFATLAGYVDRYRDEVSSIFATISTEEELKPRVALMEHYMKSSMSPLFDGNFRNRVSKFFML